MNELDAIRARLDAATPGPWEAETMGNHAADVLTSEPDKTGHTYVICEHAGSDAEFIAHAPTDIARLLAAIEAVEALAEEWRYKGEYGWGAWQEGQGPDPEGYLLDSASGELRAALSAALTPVTDVTRGAGEANEGEVAPVDHETKQGTQRGVQR